MQIISRRTLLVGSLLGSAAAIVSTRSSHAATAPGDVTLWRLDPDWGAPLTTETGSSTKSRCRGSACHNAATHRFFLTRADALAGRLHPCCLAQPQPVMLCVDLNALMPYYAARLGGVDARCPELPATLRAALYAGAVCAVGPSTTVEASGGSVPTTTTTASTTTTTAANSTTGSPGGPAVTSPRSGIDPSAVSGQPAAPPFEGVLPATR